MTNRALVLMYGRTSWPASRLSLRWIEERCVGIGVGPSIKVSELLFTVIGKPLILPANHPGRPFPDAR